jgi:hypothetical protein
MKIFIVSPDMAKYLQYVRDNNLNPDEVFYCETEEVADRDVAMNKSEGIEAKKIILE